MTVKYRCILQGHEAFGPRGCRSLGHPDDESYDAPKALLIHMAFGYPPDDVRLFGGDEDKLTRSLDVLFDAGLVVCEP